MKNIAEVIGQVRDCYLGRQSDQLTRPSALGIWCALSGVGFAGTPWNKYRAGGLGDIDL